MVEHERGVGVAQVVESDAREPGSGNEPVEGLRQQLRMHQARADGSFSARHQRLRSRPVTGSVPS
jgi:hypothetical protein